MAGYRDYWGKAQASDQVEPFHRLVHHSLDVAAVGAELLARDGRWLARAAEISGFTAESLADELPFLLAVHDLGKFSEPFQDLRPEIVRDLQGEREARSYRLRHDTAGFLLWRSWAARTPDPREASLLPQLHSIGLPAGPLGRRDLAAVTQSWMAAVLGHHGKPPENGTLTLDVFKAHPVAPLARSRIDAAAFCVDVRRLLGAHGLVTEIEDVDALIERARRASWWLAGFTILCDWLGSDTMFFPYAAAEQALEAYWPKARAAAAAAVAHSGLSASQPRHFGGVGQLFPSISDPTPLQRAASEIELGNGPQLFVLEDLTGSGKTEAALVLAQRLMAAGRADGLFFALPTMATANAMDGRVRPLLSALFDGKPSYVLAHSGPRLDDLGRLALGAGDQATGYGAGELPTATRAASEWLSDGRKKALLAELGVGTIDQALLAALQSRHAALRLLGLHRNVLVVDEVHACDAYMLGVLSAVLRMQAALGGSAILLSATLPLGQRRQLLDAFAAGLGGGAPCTRSMGYPLLTAYGSTRTLEQPLAPRSDSARTLPVAWLQSPGEVVQRLAAAVRAGACACWIRNSVKDAVEAYDAVAAALGAEHVTLFHARFALGDRLRIEQDVVARFGKGGTSESRRAHVVIATQVVEQSLDIDFDVLVTDLCPIDRVIQRAGRLQRHKSRRGRADPILEILAPPWSDAPPSGWLAKPFHRTAAVYPDPAVLWRTCRELRQRGRLALPEEARALVEGVYASDDAPSSLQTRSSAAVGQQLAHASVARNAVVAPDLGYEREGADWSSEARTPTRLGEPTTTVRLARIDARGATAWAVTEDGRPQWHLSQLSVARRLIARSSDDDEAIRRSLESTQPFVGDDVATVVLRESDDGWLGSAVAERSRGGEVREMSVQVVYSPQRGLEIREG